MSAHRILSLDDPRLDPYRDIRHHHTTAHGPSFVCEGRFVVERLLESDRCVDSVLIESGYEHWFESNIPDEVSMLIIDRASIASLVGFDFHRRVIASGPRWQLPTLKDENREWADTDTIVAAVDIQNAENLGGLIRNCSAFGASAIVVNDTTADPLSRRVLRVSMGAAFHIPILRSEDLKTDIARMKSRFNTSILAASLSTQARPLAEFERNGPVLLMFGNEATGLPTTVEDEATDILTIPMREGWDSLNVSVASGVFLYQVTQRANR